MEGIKKKKILIIEDEYALQRILKDIFTDIGFDVITAYNGEEGIWGINRERPDIVLLDCQLPKMDGYEVLRKIRENPLMINLPVVMLTAKSSETDQIKGIELGVDDYIIKPFNIQVLIAKINMILERKELSMNTNPLTQLPGNIVIYSKLQEMILKDIPFVFLYIDLADFKSYNDYYGFQKGDEVIKHTANILVSTVKEYGEKDNFVGHIGGDDFVMITTPQNYKNISEKIIHEFDKTIVEFYAPQDQERGYITATDREGNLQEIPLMTISIVCVSSLNTKIIHLEQLSRVVAELKKYAKQFNKSILVEEKRKSF